MYAEKADESNICIFENYISAEHLKKIYEYCYSINEWEPWSSGLSDKISTFETMKKNSPETFEIMQKYVNGVQKLIEFKFGRELESAHPGIRRWDAGEEQQLHADGENLDGSPNETYIVDYGSIMYLNDNYLGGEIYFPQYELNIAPKAGTLIFFPSSKYYLHGVRKILAGVRYTSPHFWVPQKHKKLVNAYAKK